MRDADQAEAGRRRLGRRAADALAAWTGLFFATFLFLRKHYQPPSDAARWELRFSVRG
jgi:hypothetical protein